jgi:CheY-like chemotaxis protein
MSLSQSIQFATDHSATILVVEDEVLVRMVLADYLQDCGFKVIEAANADEAMAIATEPTVTIDLVFSDVRMPGSIDGFALATWLREHRRDLPVMLTSGDVGQANIVRNVFPGEVFFHKPYGLENVAAKIAQTLLKAPGRKCARA